MQIKIGSFSKRHNSTKQPASAWGTTLSDVELKEDCSMEEPVFRIGFSNWDTAYNYIYVPSWDRYYFVVDVTVRIGRIWEVACRLDAAATYKSDILSGNQHILYANAANSEIVDNRIPAKTSATYSTNYVTLSQSLMTGQWKIAVSVVGDDSTTTYLLTPAQVRQLVNATDMDTWFSNLWNTATPSSTDSADYLSGETNTSQVNVTSAISAIASVQDAVSAVAKAINWLVGDGIRTTIETMKRIVRIIIATPSAMDCIRSAIFIPWDVVGDGSMQQIMLGEYPTGIQALPVYNPIQTGQVSISIPWQASDWRRNSPYHQFYLYLPFVGSVQLSPSAMMDQSSLTIYYSLNVVNGALNYRVAGTSGDITIGTFAAQTGVPYAIGASNVQANDVVMSIAGGVAATAAAAAGGAGVVAAVNLASASLAGIQPNISCVGGGSGGAASGLDMRVILHSVFHDTTASPSNVRATIGEPFDESASLASFTGFVQTEKASIQGANMSDAVRQELNTMCDNGIFIE